MPVTSLAVPTPVPGELKLTSANTWYPLQAKPTTTAGAWELPASATGLNYVLVSDAKLIWLYALNAGDAVEFSIQ
jgi:hypothetical protein